MALPVNFPLDTQTPQAYSSSVGASPIAAVLSSPGFGTIQGFDCTLAGTLTGTATVTVTNVTQGLTIGTLTLTAAGSVIGSNFTGTPATSSVAGVNAQDTIEFLSASGTGTSIPATFSITIRNN
jgi:hypothetical protein